MWVSSSLRQESNIEVFPQDGDQLLHVADCVWMAERRPPLLVYVDHRDRKKGGSHKKTKN